mgnify:FL=1
MKPFNRGIDQTERRLRTFQSRVGKTFRSVGKSVGGAVKKMASFRGAMVLAAGVTGLGLLIKKSIDFGDELAKTADKTGFTTTKLQELRVAADLAGVNVGAMAGGLSAFAKRIGEARAGTGTLITILKGMDTELLKNVQAAQNVDDAFDLIIKKGASLTSQLDRAALFAAAFGRTMGVDMTNLIKNGIGGMEAAIQRARDLGLVLEEDLLRSAEKAKDELTLLFTLIKVKVTQAVLENADAIADLATALTNSIPAIITWGREWAVYFNIIDQSAQAKMAELQAKLVGLREELEDQSALKSWADSVSGLGGQLQQRVDETQAAIERLNNSMLAALRKAERLRVAGASAAGEAPAATSGLSPFADATADLGFPSVGRPAGGSFRAAQQEGLAVMQEVIDKNNEFRAAAKAAFTETRTPMENYQARLLELQDLFANNLIDFDTYQRSLVKANDILTETKKKTQEFQKVVVVLGERMSSSFLDAIQSGEDLRGTLRGLLADVQNFLFAQAKSAFFDSLGGAAKAGGGSIFGSILGAIGFGGGGTPAAIGPGSGVTSGLGEFGGTTFPRFAQGGSFKVAGRGGTDANLVQFQATKGEQVDVTPTNQQTKRVGSTVFIDARGADSAAINRLETIVLALDGTFERRAVGAVVEAQRRDPRLRGRA